MVADIEKQIREAEWLIGVHRYDEAIEALRQNDAPNDARRCTMLAKAYHARGDTRGDVYSSHYFALRAMALGSTDPQLPGIAGIAAFKKERYAEAVKYL